MDHEPLQLSSLPFVGFRKDRVGARIIALLNVIRIKQLTGCEGRYLWLSEPDGPYPDLADPGDCLSQDLINAHITIVKEIPDLSDRRLMSAMATGVSREVLRQSLLNGQGYYTDSNLKIDILMDEAAEVVAHDVAQIAAEMRLADPVEKCLTEIRKTIAEGWPDVPPIAIHVRRGDIMYDDFWSRSALPTKYVPDEFYQAVIHGTKGRVLAFSDTPDAVRHLMKGDPRVILVDDLLRAYDLTRSGRDLVELWLMAGCGQVFAPVASAFSSAAQVISNIPSKPLPACLTEPLRISAYDALTKRVMLEPDSFYLPGDLAQSTHYAVSHGISGAMDHATFVEFLKICSARVELMDAHPFLYRDMARVALKLGQDDLARRMAKKALASPHLQPRDSSGCQTVLLELHLKSTPSDRPSQLRDPGVREALDLFFDSSGHGSTALEVALWPMITRGGEVGDLLLVDQRALQNTLTIMNAPTKDGHVPTPRVAPEPWMVLSEWSELTNSSAHLAKIISANGLWPRMQMIGPDAAKVEEMLHKGDLSGAAELTAAGGPELWGALGLIATQMRLYGRLKRSFALLEMLTPHLPGNPLHFKRLASTNAAAGTWPKAMAHLDRAIEAAPQPGLLHLTKTIWSQERGDLFTAQEAYLSAVDHLPDIKMVRRRRRLLMKTIRAAQ